MNEKDIAEQTLAITRQGILPLANGKTLDFSAMQRAAERGSVLYRPEDLHALCAQAAAPFALACAIDVTAEKTQDAAQRLVVEEGVPDVLLLNFASARNPGGGFLNGAKAQEEDLCRASGLYLCQLTQPAYYDANRAQKSMLYLDHMIYSPRVPFFQMRAGVAEGIFPASVITAPAPNAGQYRMREPQGHEKLAETLKRRARYILAIARERGYRTLVLGAWGCGVFRNDPAQVADVFANALADPAFVGQFSRVVFAVYDNRAKQENYRAFASRFL